MLKHFKGVEIPAEHQDYTKTCYASFSDLEGLRSVGHTVTYYTGGRQSPDWVEDDPGGPNIFLDICDPSYAFI